MGKMSMIKVVRGWFPDYLPFEGEIIGVSKLKGKVEGH